MKSHTPGPWMVNDKAVGGIDIEDFNQAFVVCRTSSEDYPNADEELRYARLIAAAPKLLEAAKAYMAMIEHPETHIIRVGGPDPVRTVNELLAAISKAGG